MIYLLNALFTLGFLLPVEGLNWHARIYWWAQNHPVYIGGSLGEVKLVGLPLYYISMEALFGLLVLLPTLGLVGLPLLAQLLAALLPRPGLLGFAQNASRLSVDALPYVAAPFQLRQDRVRWVWRTIDLVCYLGLAWALVIGHLAEWLTGQNLAAPPNTVPLCLNYLVAGWLAHREVGWLWVINERIRLANLD
jgi:hypothetical protein